MNFWIARIRPAFGATSSEIPHLPPEFREMEKVVRIDPIKLNVTQQDDKKSILTALVDACELETTGELFENWIKSATATAIFKSLQHSLRPQI